MPNRGHSSESRVMYIGRQRGRLGSVSEAVHAGPLQPAVQQACVCAVGRRGHRVVTGSLLRAVLCVLRRRETGRTGDRRTQGVRLCCSEFTHRHRHAQGHNCLLFFSTSAPFRCFDTLFGYWVLVHPRIHFIDFGTIHTPCGPGAIPPYPVTSPLSLSFSIYSFFPILIHASSIFFLFVPSHSIRIVPLRFHAWMS